MQIVYISLNRAVNDKANGRFPIIDITKDANGDTVILPGDGVGNMLRYDGFRTNEERKPFSEKQLPIDLRRAYEIGHRMANRIQNTANL